MERKFLVTLGFLFTIVISVSFAQNKIIQVGLIDGYGKIIIPFGKYDEIRTPGNNGVKKTRLIVKKNGFKGLVDYDGKILVPCEYDDVDLVEDEMAEVYLDGKYGLVDITTGRLVLPCVYKCLMFDKDDGCCWFEKGAKKGFVDKTGRVIPIGTYERFEDFYHCGLLRVYNKEEKYGYIDKEGKEVIPCQFDSHDELFPIAKGFLMRRNNQEKEALVDINLKQITPYKYDEIKSNGAILAVRVDNKWGFINAKGKEIIEPIYGTYGLSNNDYIEIVDKEGKKGILSVDGKEILPCEYDVIYRCYDVKDCFRIKKDGKTGVFNRNLGIIIPCYYEDIVEYEGYCFKAKRKVNINGKDDIVALYIDTKGNFLDFSDDTFRVLSGHCIKEKYNNLECLNDIRGRFIAEKPKFEVNPESWSQLKVSR